MLALPFLALAAAHLAPAAGQLPLEYRERYAIGEPRFCPVPSRVKAAGLAQREPGIAGYIDTCKAYDIKPSTDVLNRLDVGVDTLVILSPFGNLDLRALVMLLLDNNGAYLSKLRSIDFSRASLDASSMLLITQLLLHPSCALDMLDVSYQSVKLEGACSVASALRLSTTLRVLRMHACDLLDSGGQVMLDLFKNTSLDLVDLQNNFIQFDTCQAISSVAGEKGIEVMLEGNRVFDEVLNAVTHGCGVALGISGLVLLMVKVKDKPYHYKVSIAAYAVSGVVLYLFSTLYHSFFALGHTTTEIFRTLDYSGIFLLIAGTYTPLFGILFHGEWWAMALVRGMWTTAFLGICIIGFYRGPGDAIIRCTLFLLMGWTCMAAIRRIFQELGFKGSALLVAGGVLYSAGVPWYLRGGHVWEMPDHSIWHLFVLSASACHFFGIYWFVAGREPIASAGLSEPLTSSELSADSDSDDEDHEEPAKVGMRP